MAAFGNRQCLFTCNGIAYLLWLDNNCIDKRARVINMLRKNSMLLIEVVLI